jgi:FtsX-like permease family
VQSLLAGWRVSLHRTRADWPIVGAAWLITLLAAILLSAGPIYSTATSVAGLRRTLADAPPTQADVQVSLYSPPADASAVDGRVDPELRQLIAPTGGSIVRYFASSRTLALPGAGGDQAILGFLEGISARATLVDGTWPADSGGSSAPLQVVVLDAVAQELGLKVGDQVTLTTHILSQTLQIPVRIVGIFAPDGVADPYWYGDTQLTSGVTDNASYRTFGPFLTTPSSLLQRAGVDSVHMQWRIYPDFARLTVDGATQMRNRLAVLPERLQIATGDAVEVGTGLGTILGDAQRSLLVTRAGVLLLIVQLGILAAYALILTASLLVDHRRIDTALLRSRGAGARQVALLALAEGLVLALPAVLLAPWLAVAALSLLNVVGPLAEVGLSIAPRVTLDGYLAAAAAGIVCVALLALPATLAARGFAAEQGGLSRQETRPFGQRLGLDLALLAVTGIAIWQLRLYGAPLTRTVEGSLGLDPLLVAAPAIGLLAGGVFALRVLPLLAEALESGVSRGRALIVSLGSRQLARRPLRYTRSALLLMLAISMGVFALAYAATWSSSQRDQAAYQAGADVRVTAGSTSGGLPSWALPSAYGGLSGVVVSMPVERNPGAISVAAGTGDLLALDAGRAADIVLFRPDQASKPLGTLMQELLIGRPEPQLAVLPQGATDLRIVPRLDVGAISTMVGSGPGQSQLQPLDPTALAGVQVSASAIVRDAAGLLYTVRSDTVPLAGPNTFLVLPLAPTDQRTARDVASIGAGLDGPVELAQLSVNVWLPEDTVMTGGLVGVASVSAGPGPDGPWSDVSLAASGGWRARMGQGGRVLTDVPSSQVQGTAVQLTGTGPQGIIIGIGTRQASARISFLPATIASLGSAVPAIANSAFLAATGSEPGQTIPVSVEGTIRQVTIAAAVDAFPTTDPGRPLLVFDEPTLALLRLQATNTARSADEWWMATAGGQTTAVTDALRGVPFDAAGVVSVTELTRSLSTDPVALGIIGALALGFVATGLFAVVGLTVSAAVSARQRRTEFALMRALGLSGRQLSGWLWLENGSLVLVSLLAGMGLGLLVSWVVLPSVSVTQQATVPVPPVIVEVPWGSIGVLGAASALALGGSVVAIGWVLRRLGMGSILRMGED